MREVYLRAADLPDFDAPPVAEVVLSVQFERIATLRAPHVGLLWAKVRPEFPKVEERSPIEPSFEKFDQPPTHKIGVRFEALEVPPLARVLFLNNAEDQLIQVQQDRILHNWRKAADSVPYPRYNTIRSAFIEDLAMFQEYLREEELGLLQINQCEVTYVNHIPCAGDALSDGVGGHAAADKIFKVISAQHTSFLPAPENVTAQVQYVMREFDQPVGRLHVSIQPAWRKPDNAPVYILELTARGTPLGAGTAGAIRFLDLGHDWIVRGFKDLTTIEMRAIWRINHG
jgi:uncharacterized protein (TIGR04255 family)